ncbi:MAG TPA: DsbE family thiol:disulfide interchange protein [Burkholderiaceae bacterium]|nr:DsbE family thiol:disulfide interchange protein [Burkholderiaceae bacterium]
MKAATVIRAIVPLGVFALLVVALGFGLRRDPKLLPSVLVGRPAPAFALQQLARPGERVTQSDLRGQVVLLNVWASWCVACREEHVTLLALARDRSVPVYGLNYKDTRDEALKVLEKEGNPYVMTLFDADGRTGIDYGVYGVPETFVIDRQGIVRYKHVGPITEQALHGTILPLVARLQAPGSAR